MSVEGVALQTSFLGLVNGKMGGEPVDEGESTVLYTRSQSAKA